MVLPSPLPPMRVPDLGRICILVGLGSGVGIGCLALVVLAAIDRITLCIGFALAADCPPARLFDEPEVYPFYIGALAVTLGFAFWFGAVLRRGRTR